MPSKSLLARPSRCRRRLPGWSRHVIIIAGVVDKELRGGGASGVPVLACLRLPLRQAHRGAAGIRGKDVEHVIVAGKPLRLPASTSMRPRRCTTDACSSKAIRYGADAAGLISSTASVQGRHRTTHCLDDECRSSPWAAVALSARRQRGLFQRYIPAPPTTAAGGIEVDAGSLSGFTTTISAQHPFHECRQHHDELGAMAGADRPGQALPGATPTQLLSTTPAMIITCPSTSRNRRRHRDGRAEQRFGWQSATIRQRLRYRGLRSQLPRDR